jgi:hypothetical protein
MSPDNEITCRSGKAAFAQRLGRGVRHRPMRQRQKRAVSHIVNYGERFHADERISTGFVESAVNQIVDKRFDKRQSMRWTPRGAHLLLLQTRTRVLNGDLDQLIRRRYPAFRKPEGADLAPVL